MGFAARRAPPFVVALLLVACTSSAQQARDALAEGRRLAEHGQLNDAQRAYETAMRLDPALHEARGRLARLALDRGRPADAKTQADGALRLVPTSPTYLEVLGRADLALGDDAGALDALGRARGYDGTRERLGFELGRIHERRHELVDAAAEYRRLAHADVHALDARVALGRVLLPGPPRDEARATLEEAKALATPGSTRAAEIDALLAWCDRLDAPPPDDGTDVAPRLPAQATLGILRLLGSIGEHNDVADTLMGGDMERRDVSGVGVRDGTGLRARPPAAQP